MHLLNKNYRVFLLRQVFYIIMYNVIFTIIVALKSYMVKNNKFKNN